MAPPGILEPRQRIKLNEVEPWDEWEDFALFATHYFCLIATSAQALLNIDDEGYNLQFGLLDYVDSILLLDLAEKEYE